MNRKHVRMVDYDCLLYEEKRHEETDLQAVSRLPGDRPLRIIRHHGHHRGCGNNRQYDENRHLRFVSKRTTQKGAVKQQPLFFVRQEPMTHLENARLHCNIGTSRNIQGISHISSREILALLFCLLYNDKDLTKSEETTQWERRFFC